MLTPINEGFVEQWRSVGATDAELAEVVTRDGVTVLVDVDHPNVSQWVRLVAMRQKPAKPSRIDSAASKPPADSKPVYIAERLAICHSCEHCRDGRYCGLLLDRGKGAVLMGSRGIPNQAARCPADPPRWVAVTKGFL